MTDTAFITPGTVTEDTVTGGAGTDLLTNPNNLISTVSDAVVDWATGARLSAYYRLSNIDFSSVPDGSAIDGIRARVNHYSENSVSDNIEFIMIALVDETGAYRTAGNKVSGGSGEWPTTDTSTTYGTTTDLWGESSGFWTAAKIKDADFGLVVQIRTVGGLSGTTPDGQIRDIALSVSYTAGASNTVTETAIATDVFLGSRIANATVTETSSATDSNRGTRTAIGSFIEAQTATDSFSGSKVTSSSLSESATATDSHTSISTTSGTFTETATASDSYTTPGMWSETIAETATATDTIAGSSVITGLVTETATASDAYSGVKITDSSLSESVTTSDNLSNTVVFSNSLAETAAATDSFVEVRNEVEQVVESVACNDNYDSSVVPFVRGDWDCPHGWDVDSGWNECVDAAVEPTGPGDDDKRWREHLAWLKRKKLKELKRRAKKKHIPPEIAEEVATKAESELARQVIAYKWREREIQIDADAFRSAIQKAVAAIYEQQWADMLVEFSKQYTQELEDEELFLMTM